MAGESAADAARRMQQKSERLAQAAELWAKGAEGERVTAAALATLPADEWTVFHDVPWPGRPRANVDHVLIGPPGLYVVDSKNWSGRVEVVRGVLRQNGRARMRAMRGAEDAANAIGRVAPSAPSQAVHPVLCFVGHEQIAGHAGRAMVCTTATIVQVLSGRPKVLDGPARERLRVELGVAFDEARTGSFDAATLVQTQETIERSQHRFNAQQSAPVQPVGGKRNFWKRLSLVGMRSQRRQPASGRGPELGRVVGTWRGMYRSGRHTVSGELIIEVADGPGGVAVTGTLRFGPSDASPRVKHGSFRLEGSIAGDSLVMHPTGWIQQPPRYQLFGINAAVPGPGAHFLVGTTVGARTTRFSFARG